MQVNPSTVGVSFGFSTSDGNVAARSVYTGSQLILLEFLDPKYSSRLSLDELLDYFLLMTKYQGILLISNCRHRISIIN